MAEILDLIIVGAGPGGIALAAEAQASGIDQSRTLILEKWKTHNWAIRQLYPEQKVTTATYKGFSSALRRSPMHRRHDKGGDHSVL